jgi:hypothetical protein
MKRCARPVTTVKRPVVAVFAKTGIEIPALFSEKQQNLRDHGI